MLLFIGTIIAPLGRIGEDSSAGGHIFIPVEGLDRPIIAQQGVFSATFNFHG
jgi:hypothetical protein